MIQGKLFSDTLAYTSFPLYIQLASPFGPVKLRFPRAPGVPGVRDKEYMNNEHGKGAGCMD